MLNKETYYDVRIRNEKTLEDKLIKAKVHEHFADVFVSSEQIVNGNKGTVYKTINKE